MKINENNMRVFLKQIDLISLELDFKFHPNNITFMGEIIKTFNLAFSNLFLDEICQSENFKPKLIDLIKYYG